MKTRNLVAAGLALALVGCVALQFSEVSPRFSEFHPKSVAILPYTNTMGLENANEATNNYMATSLQKSKLFERIVDPGQVRGAMGSNDELLNAITNFRTKWVATGMSDKNLAGFICKTLNADSIVFGEITQWGEQSSGLQKFYRAGMTLRWVDQSGEILWKAAHTIEEKGGMFGGGVQGTMNSVLNMFIMAWPKQK